MEVYSFDTKDVERKLNEINFAIHTLTFTVNGLKNLDLINDDQLCALELILYEANNKADALIKGMKPIWLGESERIAILFGVQE